MGLLNGWKKDTPSSDMQVRDQATIETELRNFDFSNAPSSTGMQPHDLYLFDQLGYEPLQLVFGNVVYSMGLRGVIRSVMRAFQRGEMTEFSQLNEDARQLARNRMLREATALGADTVVGVEIEVREYADFLEITATGTAAKKVKEKTVLGNSASSPPAAVGL